MRTYMPKKGEAGDRWFVVDADGKTLGRLATTISMKLMGKDKPQYATHVDCGDHVIVINAARVKLTGKKWDDKVYSRHTGHPGGLKQVTAGKMRDRHPERLVEFAVAGMLPKTKLGRDMIKKLKVYAGGEHPHQAQVPQPLPATMGSR